MRPWRGLPDRDRSWRAMSAEAFILRDQLTACLQCRRVDQAVRRIAWKIRGEGRRGKGDRGRDRYCPNLRRELTKPRREWKRDRDALMRG